jgi:hypothetical protein
VLREFEWDAALVDEFRSRWRKRAKRCTYWQARGFDETRNPRSVVCRLLSARIYWAATRASGIGFIDQPLLELLGAPCREDRIDAQHLQAPLPEGMAVPFAEPAAG